MYQLFQVDNNMTVTVVAALLARKKRPLLTCCRFALRTGQQHEHAQDAQLSQRDRAAGCVIVLAKSGSSGRQYFTDTVGLSSSTVA